SNGKRTSSKEGFINDERKNSLQEIKNALDTLASQMTGKDYDAFMEEGYSFDDTKVEELVTVVEKIKIKLATYCEDYELTSDVDIDKIEAVVGSAGMAYSVVDKLNKNNLPVNEETVSEIMEAFEVSKTLEPVTKDQASFLIANEMEPSIENIYIAQHSGTIYKQPANQITETEWQQLKPQVEKILSQMGLVVNEEVLENAKWILEQGIPLEVETLMSLQDIVGIEVNAEAEVTLDTIVSAMAKGKRGVDALLTGEEYSADRVTNAIKVIEERVQNKFLEADESIDAITARRQLEEIRLRMTKEAGLAMLKKGIEIETAPLEELVEELRALEDNYYKQLYKSEGIEPNEESFSLLKETTQKVEFLKETPDYILGQLLEDYSSHTIGKAYEAATKLQSKLDIVGESYEALMTKPNYEYGDRIAKAFENIDEILEDLGLEVSRENQRAVKILGYNQMDITNESVLQIKELDESFQTLLKGMTPRVTMHMVENNINPLNTRIDTLNKEIEKIQEELGPKQEEKYSEFLWKLEHNEGISQEDRTAYIEMYRLLNTVEKTEGAVIGALVNQGSEVNLKNLLTAAKTRNTKPIDVVVTRDFGFLDESYGDYKVDQFRQVSRQEEAVKMLTEENLPVTLNNLLTAGIMTSDKGSVFSKLQEKAEKQDSDAAKQLVSESETLFEALSDSESMKEAYKDLADKASELLKEAYESVETKHLDLETLKRISNGFQLMTSMTQNESYQVPLNISGEVTAVNLKIIRGTKDTGKVSIEMELEEIGKVLAEFRIKGNIATGLINLGSVKAVESIKEKVSNLPAMLEQEGITLESLNFSASKEIKRAPFIQTKKDEADKQTETSKTKTLYGIAKTFITVIKESGGIQNEN
ncbi:MAG: hypothetical protein GX913_05365, partial [Clostridiales bacterium]|nr:hypothetical protein [Clostridiales bacterium]